MNAKKLILASLAGGVVTFLLGGLWHAIILADFYETHWAALARPEANMMMVALGSLVIAVLMAYTYPIGYKGGSAVKEGFRFGALVGLIWVLPVSLIFSGVWNYPLVAVIVDSAWHIVEQGVVGIVIALIYGTAAASSE